MVRSVLDLELPFVSTTTEDFARDPHGVWRNARSHHWLVCTEYGPTVITHADAAQLLRNPGVDGGGDHFLEVLGLERDSFIYEFVNQSILATMQGERHGRLRRLVSGAFTPRAVERMRATMREVAEQMIDDFAADDRCEFLAAFADRYPVTVFCRLIGIDDTDVDEFARWSNDVGLFMSSDLRAVRRTVEDGVRGLYALADDVIERRRRNLGDDLLSDLIRAEEAGDRLSASELRWMIVLLTFSGDDTTRNELAFIVRMLAETPDVWSALADDRELVSNAIDEGMRLEPVGPCTHRTAVSDVEHAGVLFPAGTRLAIRLDSANRDPAVFDHPDEFQPRRPNADRQLSFGAGLHYCLGANVARIEMQEALGALAPRSRPGSRSKRGCGSARTPTASVTWSSSRCACSPPRRAGDDEGRGRPRAMRGQWRVRRHRAGDLSGR